MKYTLLALSIYLLETCTMNGDPGEAYLEFDRAQEYQMSRHGDIYGIYPSPIDSNMITNDTLSTTLKKNKAVHLKSTAENKCDTISVSSSYEH